MIPRIRTKPTVQTARVRLLRDLDCGQRGAVGRVVMTLSAGGLLLAEFRGHAYLLRLGRDCELVTDEPT